jgi:hypothetical protein
MEESRCRTVSARVGAIALLLVLTVTTACSGRYAHPRTLASLGGLAVGAGSLTWATGQGLQRNGHATDALVTTGFVTVAVGLAAVVAAGGWMAVAVSCTADPDCADDEQCREIPAPPGGIPYKQCMSQ